MDAALLEAVRTWMAEDPDPTTITATQRMLDAGDEAALRECFGARLQFGTAGLRGKLGPGPNCMNRALVRRVTAGLGHYLVDQIDGRPSVVIGFDGRHGSRAFAADAAAVLGALDIQVFLYDAVVPTPELAHAVPHLGCHAGIMVTASHNPPQDNGYKVYWGNGAQIIPPHDRGISDAIDAIGALSEVACPPLASLGDLVAEVPGEVLSTYLTKVHALRVHDDTGVRVVYTAMHGVGGELVQRVLTEAGHTDFHGVPEQFAPDGDFPTVSFPNPEEPGALDLAKALAEDIDADLIIANDPDADRLAVALPIEGGWRQLTGNQVGVLLAADLLANTGGERLVATTIVSSTLLSRMAERHGTAYAETLTGFKWIANQAIDFHAAGGHFVMGYEEALGYSIGEVVRDKDGVSAALILVDLAAWAKARGETLLDRLAALYKGYGVYASRQVSKVMPGTEGAAQIRAILAGLRSDPPTEIGGHPVERLRDVSTGQWRDLRTGETGTIDLPASNVLAWELEGGSRVLARPSGTEPKIKFYFEVVTPWQSDDTLATAEARAEQVLQALADDFMAGL